MLPHPAPQLAVFGIRLGCREGTTPMTASETTSGKLPAIEEADGPMLSADEFKAAFRNHPAGVALITAEGPEGPVAMTATSVSSASVTPPLLVFSVSELSSSAPALRDAETVVVHLLEAEQLHLAELGATSGIDRFADTTLWTRLPTGEPLFPEAPSWIRGRVVGTVPAGVATIVLVQALEARVREPDGTATHPLVYHNRTWHRLGEHSRIP